MSKKKNKTGNEWQIEINNNNINKNKQNQEEIYTNKTKFNFLGGGREFYFILFLKRNQFT